MIQNVLAILLFFNSCSIKEIVCENVSFMFVHVSVIFEGSDFVD